MVICRFCGVEAKSDRGISSHQAKNKKCREIRSRCQFDIFFKLPLECQLDCLDYLTSDEMYRCWLAGGNFRRFFMSNYNFRWKTIFQDKYWRILPRKMRFDSWGMAYLKLENSLCFDCNKFTTRVDAFFQIPLCNSCRKTNLNVQLICKSKARKQYKLSERDIGELPFLEMDNPHYKCASAMKLYLLSDVHGLSRKKHGVVRKTLQIIRKS